MRSTPENILIVRNGRLGDFLVAVPAAAIVRKAFPESNIIWVSASSARPEIQKMSKFYADSAILPWFRMLAHGLIDEVISFTPTSPLSDVRHIKEKCGGKRIDAVLHLPFGYQSLTSKLKRSAFSKLVAPLSPSFGAWTVAGGPLAIEQFGSWSGHQVVAPVMAANDLLRYFNTKADYKVEFPMRPSEPSAGACDVLRDLPTAKFVVVAPGATFKHKEWPTHNFKLVIEELYRKFGLSAVITGIGAHKDVTNRLMQEVSTPIVDATSKLTLEDLGAILYRSALCVTNDGGTAHLASAFNCPTVSIFSAILPRGIWEPWTFREASIRYETRCSPCWNEFSCPMGTKECVTTISPAKVILSCAQLLELTFERENSG